MWRLGLIAEYAPDLEDVSAQNFRLDMRVRPDRSQNLVLRDQSPCPSYHVMEHGKGIGHQGYERVPAPEALIHDIQAVGPEQPHCGPSEILSLYHPKEARHRYP